MGFNIADLTLVERETILSMSGDDRSVWHIYCDDPVMQAKLEKAQVELVRTEPSGAKHYKIGANRVTFRKPVVISEKERQRRSERMRKMVNGRKNDG